MPSTTNNHIKTTKQQKSIYVMHYKHSHSDAQLTTALQKHGISTKADKQNHQINELSCNSRIYWRRQTWRLWSLVLNTFVSMQAEMRKAAAAKLRSAQITTTITNRKNRQLGLCDFYGFESQAILTFCFTSPVVTVTCTHSQARCLHCLLPFLTADSLEVLLTTRTSTDLGVTMCDKVRWNLAVR